MMNYLAYKYGAEKEELICTVKLDLAIFHTSTSNFSGIVEYMPNPPLEFQEGDVLGVYQPEADQSKSVVYYQRSTGPSSYGYIGDAPRNSISLNDDYKFTKYDYPLVNVEVTKKGKNDTTLIEVAK